MAIRFLIANQKNLDLHCRSFFDHEIQNLKSYSKGHSFFDNKQRK